MKLPTKILLAPDLAQESTAEARAIIKASVLLDVPYQRVEFEDLAKHRQELASGRILPVGTVEYLRKAMRVAGLNEPENLSYHPSIRRYLGRTIHTWRAGELLRTPLPRPIFVKPQETKLFTGFVIDPKIEDSQYVEHDRQQLVKLRALDPQTLVWTCNAVDFVSEWRYYVADGQTSWSARYDDGDEHKPEPDPAVVALACRSAWQALGHPFALDIGVLESGATVVCELNDAWAIGLYSTGKKAMQASDYLKYLFARWTSIKRVPD